MERSRIDPSQLTFLAGGGEMGARMREMDWSQTALGSPEGWPQSLRSTVSMLLPSKAQIILFWGAGFNVLYNDAYRPVFGAKHPDALGRPGGEAWSEIWDTQVGLRGLLEGVVRTGEAFWGRDLLFVLERHGFVEDTYFDVSYDPVRVESGAVGGVFCIVRETTERVVGERRLALLRDLAARNATARTQRDACVLAMNTLSATPDVAFALAYLDDELQASTRGAEEALAETPPELVKTLTIPASAGGRSGRLIIGVNPRRPFDAGYRTFVDLVADQVATAVANARAYESERQRAEALAAIDRAKTTFFSNVSHEFRTPLTLLVGPLADVLADPAALLPAHRESIEVAHRNALRLLRLVNTLLDFSRIEAGRIDASYEPTDLAALTTDLASAFRSAMEKAGLTFVVDCPPLPQPVYVDREMWEKVVLNLLSNAFKFTFEGEVRVELTWHDDRVELSVRDTGVGIPDEDLGRVFERFHRVKHARARTYEGTGIGLALVQELARLHGGTVAVASESGRGTTFTVSIATGRSHLPADRISSPRQLAPTTGGATSYVEEAMRWLPEATPGARPFLQSLAPPSSTSDRDRDEQAQVLIADDNADMREYLARILGPHHRVLVVTNGRAALERIQATPPDLVVTDVMMPELDGFGLLAAIRSDPRTRSVPVVLLSARAGEESRIDGLRAGANEYLVKPFSARELLACVTSQLQLARVRRETERILRYQSEQHLTLLNQAPLGVYLVDADFRVAEANPIALAVFGEIPGGVIGRDFDEVIHILWQKQYADRLVDIFRHTLATGEPYVTLEQAEFRIDRGTTEYYEWRVDRITLPDGRFGLVCYFRDISSQVRARNAIAESEQRFRAFVTATSDAVYRMAADWSEMRYLEGRDLIANTLDPNRNWMDKYIHPDDQSRVMAAIHHAIATKSTFELEHRVYRLDGTLGWTFSRAVPIVDPNGNVLEWLGTARDVTERKRGEEALRRSEQRLVEANRVKDEFLATLSHELRTPLNAVLGWAHMLRTGTLRPDARDRALQSLERNAKAQAQLVDDLLDVSRIMSGKLALKREPLDLTAVIAAAVDAIRPAATSNDLQLRVGIDAGSEVIVEGDAGRLQQVVSNLLSNAVKFTPPGGTIDVDLRDADSVIELIVRDSGDGIDPAFLPHVFDRFRQFDNTKARKHAGLGLGLAIVRHLTEAHAGTVSAHSDGHGKGACFIVRLPRVQHHHGPWTAAANTAKTAADALDGIRVLIVDDDPDARELAKVVVERAGAEAVVAESAAQALRRLQNQQFDLLVADIGMPEQDGYSMMRAIRRRAPADGGRIRAIAVSAYTSPRDRDEALAAGFDEHLGKPAEPEQLLAALAALSRELP